MIFNGQTLRLSLDTDYNITGYTGSIKYIKPNGVTGEWAGTIIGDVVIYDITQSDTELFPGQWRVQAKAVNGTSIKYGRWQIIDIRKHL